MVRIRELEAEVERLRRIAATTAEVVDRCRLVRRWLKDRAADAVSGDVRAAIEDRVTMLDYGLRLFEDGAFGKKEQEYKTYRMWMTTRFTDIDGRHKAAEAEGMRQLLRGFQSGRYFNCAFCGGQRRRPGGVAELDNRAT